MQKVPELVVRERMSQGKGVKCTQEESEMMVYLRNERQGEQLFGRRHRRNEKMLRYQSGRGGSMLEEVG